MGISVNLSPKQFHQPRLVDDVAEVLQETGLAACNLTLEGTESVMVQDSGFAETTLEKLRNLGVSIDIDDFRTGYSSFDRLKCLPINTLKIDRSFVARLGEDPRDEHIIQAIIKVAYGLGLGVVAEGVEASEQATRLRALGCEMAQGYYFSKPLPSEAIDTLLTSQLASD